MISISERPVDTWSGVSAKKRPMLSATSTNIAYATRPRTLKMTNSVLAISFKLRASRLAR